MTNLTGTIPDAIGDWENITEIELFYSILFLYIYLQFILYMNMYLYLYILTLNIYLFDIGDFFDATAKYHGTIPSAITKLNKLQILSLDFNNLSGTIPSGVSLIFYFLIFLYFLICI